MFGADTPFVLDHHKTDTACEGGIQLGIVEPAVHVDMSLVVNSPVGSGASTDGNSHEIDGQNDGNSEESDDTAEFSATGKLVEQDETYEDDEQHSPLSQGTSPINLEKHSLIV